MTSNISPWRGTMHGPTARCVLVLLVLGGPTACAVEAPTVVPTTGAATPPPPPSPPTPTPTFRPCTRQAAIYDRVTPSVIPGSSRYVVYDNGRFTLQYLRPDWGLLEYPGNYSCADSLIAFSFDASSPTAWLATGTVHGDSTLVVAYNSDMSLSDFEDGVYRSAASVPSAERIYVANTDGSRIVP